ncbi:Transcriptional regulator, MarR family protein (fragment) [Thiocapsa sp. KS1]
MLWESDGLTQRELIARLDVEQPTMTNTLARMERDGLIRRAKDPADGRAQRIWLTESARALEEPATAAAEAVNARALEQLTPEERAAFLGLVRKVIAGLQAETAAHGLDG